MRQSCGDSLRKPEINRRHPLPKVPAPRPSEQDEYYQDSCVHKPVSPLLGHQMCIRKLCQKECLTRFNSWPVVDLIFLGLPPVRSSVTEGPFSQITKTDYKELEYNHKENPSPEIGNSIKTLVSPGKPMTLERTLVRQWGQLQLSDPGQVAAPLWASLSGL